MSSTSKWTPGPWQIIEPTAEHPSRAMVGARGVDIYDAPLTNETLANARLIAAAPALYGACHEALRMVRNCPGNWENAVREQLEAALAKARGANDWSGAL